MKNYLFTILLSALCLQSCTPALVFTAASATTLASAKDRSLGDTLDDNLIYGKIKKEFIAKGFKKLYFKIGVEVVQSRVLLTGEVESDDDIINALEIVWGVSGVKEVLNELKVSEESKKFDAAQYIKDSWISSRIKASIFFNRSIKFINYTIVVQKNIVYVFGIARNEEELAKVTQIASEVSGVEKVISHAHLKEQFSPKESSSIKSENLTPEEASL
ncbi:MAG: BON domain-containing protein [Alphaproteobacteria bacterium]|nr:BON domain-containing protein [Alphaproteobacteria bacterium]